MTDARFFKKIIKCKKKPSLYHGMKKKPKKKGSLVDVIKK